MCCLCVLLCCFLLLFVVVCFCVRLLCCVISFIVVAVVLYLLFVFLYHKTRFSPRASLSPRNSSEVCFELFVFVFFGGGSVSLLCLCLCCFVFLCFCVFYVFFNLLGCPGPRGGPGGQGVHSLGPPHSRRWIPARRFGRGQKEVFTGGAGFYKPPAPDPWGPRLL